MFRAILPLALLVPIFSFAEGTQRWFTENRTYSHHLFITEKACLDAQRGGMFFNCSQTAELNLDGTASVMLTDIMDIGTYEVSDNTVTINLREASDAPSKMTFIVDRTGRNLIREGTTTVWELDQNGK